MWSLTVHYNNWKRAFIRKQLLSKQMRGIIVPEQDPVDVNGSN